MTTTTVPNSKKDDNQLRKRKKDSQTTKSPSASEPTKNSDKLANSPQRSSCFGLCFRLLLSITFISCCIFLATLLFLFYSPNGDLSFSWQYKSNHNKQRTKDQSVALEVPLEDIYFGNTVKFEKPRTVVCRTCEGQGIRPDANLEPCTKCNGQGYVKRRQRMGAMQYEQKFECPICHGNGAIITEADKCKKCNGKGMIRERTSIEIEIPRGIGEGQYVIAKGYAEEHPLADTGDLYVYISAEKHPFFTRKDDIHLEFVADISLLEALVGFKRKVKHISGEIITIRRDEVTSHGQVIEFVGKGMPIPGSPGESGNMYMIVNVEFPVSLPPEKIETVKQLLS